MTGKTKTHPKRLSLTSCALEHLFTGTVHRAKRSSQPLSQYGQRLALPLGGRCTPLHILSAGQKPADGPYACEGQLHRDVVAYDEPACGLSDLEGPLELVDVLNSCSFCGVAKPAPWHRFVQRFLVESGGEPQRHAVVHHCR